MALRDEVLAVLQADAYLAGYLSGGIYAAAEISRQSTPTAFDANSEILPCALVRVEAEAPWGPFESSARAFVMVFLYQRSGFDQVDLARERIYTLLHRQTALTGRWEVMHVNDILDQEDQALACSLAVSRFQVLRIR